MADVAPPAAAAVNTTCENRASRDLRGPADTPVADLSEDDEEMRQAIQNSLNDPTSRPTPTPAVRTKTLAERLAEVAAEEELTEAEVEAAMK